MEHSKKLPYPFLRNCAALLLNYTGEIPFHLYLKQEFKKNSSWGGKDRKNYRKYSYLFWRNAELLDKTNTETVIQWLDQMSRSLSEKQSTADSKPLTDSKHIAVTEQLSVAEPLAVAEQPAKSEHLQGTLAKSQNFWDEFPPLSKDLLTNSQPAIDWIRWFTTEPPVWIKVVNPAHFNRVKDRLQQLSISILEEKVELQALSIPAQSNIQELEEEGWVIIQDIGSQQSVVWKDFIDSNTLSNSNGMTMVWDACCGAGGKSLSLRILYSNLDIQCSDVRQSILDNLTSRFNKTRLVLPFIFKHNLEVSANKKTKFRIVLADIPCSGSGTWRRNPEAKWYYDEDKWQGMVSKQLQMVSNAAASVADDGFLIVCTCSLFARENEALIDSFLAANALENKSNSTKWEILDQRFLGGIRENGDYIYRSILKRLQ